MGTDRKEIFKNRFQKHYPRLCNIAYGYVLNRDDSEDIVQELFINIWNKGKDDLSDKEFLAYMITSVRNSCISFLRVVINVLKSVKSAGAAFLME